jgi:hypothetical protein
VVEEQRSWQAQSRDGAEAIAQFDGDERVEADLLERTVRIDGVRCRETKNGGHLGKDEVENGAVALGIGEGDETLLERRRCARTVGAEAPGGGADETSKQRRRGVGLCVQQSGVKAHRYEACVETSEGYVEEGKTVLGRERQRALTAYADAVNVGQACGHTALCPGAEGKGKSRQSEGVTVTGQRIEEGVGGGIAGLPRAAEHGSERREKHEHG